MVTVKDVEFSYDSRALFSGLNFNLQRGSIYGLLGRNGAGKSTLLKIISGMIFPKKGSVSVSGREPYKREPAFLADLFFVTEDPFLPRMRGVDYVSLYSPFYAKFDKQLFVSLCSETGIDPVQNLSNMSYGMKKKFLIAFAFATRASVIVLDEPTNGLDIPSKATFRRTLASSVNEDQIVVISTHQVRDLEAMIDPVIIIDQGKVLMNMARHELSEILAFSIENEIPENALYYEKTPGGYAVIKSGKGEREMDIEVLFNAVVSGALAEEFDLANNQVCECAL